MNCTFIDFDVILARLALIRIFLYNLHVDAVIEIKCAGSRFDVFKEPIDVIFPLPQVATVEPVLCSILPSVIEVPVLGIMVVKVGTCVGGKVRISIPFISLIV